MACEGSGESVYFSTLGKITSFDVNGTTLTLIMGDIAMMRFQKNKTIPQIKTINRKKLRYGAFLSPFYRNTSI